MLPRDWLSKNVDELCALIIIVSGIVIIFRSIVFGVQPGTETFVELLKYLVTSATVYLFGKQAGGAEAKLLQ